MEEIKRFIFNLNIFEDESNENKRHLNIISTRIYFILLTILLIVLAIFTRLATEIILIEIKNPTVDQWKNFPPEIQCPCSQTSVSYEKFISLEAKFHKVCSSDFVSDRWINLFYFGLASTYFVTYDFRSSANGQFQALAAFCRLSQSNVMQSISAYSKNRLLSTDVIQEKVLKAEMEASIEQFYLSLPKAFRTQLQLVRVMTIANQLYTALPLYTVQRYYQTSSREFRIVNFQYPFSVNMDGTPCFCQSRLDCTSSSNLYSGFAKQDTLAPGSDPVIVKVLQGFVAGCLPVSAMLYSTLGCFYDQSCLNDLLWFLRTDETFIAMSADPGSRFHTNLTVNTLINELMIESWTADVSYEKYFEQCSPKSCTYSKNAQHSFLYVLAKLISLLGGLTTILSLIVPNVVKFIKRPRNQIKSQSIPLMVRIQKLKNSLKTLISELNIFQSHRTSDRHVYYQRIGTQLYIILLIISIVLIGFFKVVVKDIRKEIVFNTTIEQFYRLQEAYPSSLVCQCQTISMNYSTFVTIEPFYHQVCSSNLISTRWIGYHRMLLYFYRRDEYELHASAHFSFLKTLCAEAKETISDALSDFLQKQLTSSKVLVKDLFEKQVNSSINNWRSDIITRFMLTIKLIDITTQGNLLMNGNINTDYQLNYTTREITILPATYSNCTCGISDLCNALMRLYHPGPIDISEPLFTVPNFYSGCFPVQALFESTLECFYDINCMREIDRYKLESLGDFYNFSALDPTRNPPYEKIRSIVEKLMVDQWKSEIFYKSYYEKCSPSFCSYEYFSRNSILPIVIDIIGIFGGLSVGLRLIILVLLHGIYKITDGVHLVIFQRFIKSLFTFQNEERMIDRIQFLLMIITFGLIYAFVTFSPKLITVVIKEPSISAYRDLLNGKSNSLQCSCSQISMKYESFLNISVRFHEICSSEFVQDRWINYLYEQRNLTFAHSHVNFLISAYAQFQLLASFCELSKETANEILFQILTSDLINTQLLSPDELDEEIRKISNEYQITISKLFVNGLSLIRDTTSANKIMSALSTNWIYATPDAITDYLLVRAIPVDYGACSCGLSTKCTQQSETMLYGCLPLESLFQSTISCLYDQQCIDVSGNFKSLNISSMETSQFHLNDTFETIINKLMIEQYMYSISFGNYFDRCSPSLCSYSYIDKTNSLDGLTNVISLYGGLTIFCRVIAVIIVKIIQYRKERVVPLSNQTTQ